VTSFQNAPRCSEQAADILSAIGTVLGGIADAIWDGVEVIEPTNNADGLKRAAVLTHWLFQDCNNPQEALRAMAERLGVPHS
jgi:hypothetical protein